MSPVPAVVQYWDSGEPPDYLRERIESFRELNPEMSHRLFDEQAADEFIAERFAQRDVEAFRACAVPTMQSDYFRYCAVHALGGVYADVGFSCLAPLASLRDELGGSQIFRRDPGYILSGFFLFDAPGHPLPRLVLDVANHNIEQRAAERVQMVTGPWILSGLALLHELVSTAAAGGGAPDAELGRFAAPFCRQARKLVLTAGAARWVEPMASRLFEAVGSTSRLTEAFEGVRVTSFATATRWIGEPTSQLPYKQEDRYWLRWQGRRSIFRQ